MLMQIGGRSQTYVEAEAKRTLRRPKPNSNNRSPHDGSAAPSLGRLSDPHSCNCCLKAPGGSAGAAIPFPHNSSSDSLVHLVPSPRDVELQLRSVGGQAEHSAPPTDGQDPRYGGRNIKAVSSPHQATHVVWWKDEGCGDIVSIVCHDFHVFIQAPSRSISAEVCLKSIGHESK